MRAGMVAGALFALSGCNNWVVGDSIAFMSGRYIAANRTTNLDADPLRGAYQKGLAGRPDGWSSVLARIPSIPKDGWLVVELGTNDLLRPPAEWATFIRDVVAKLPDDRCLAWVTPYHPDRAPQAAQYEALLNTLLVAQPCRRLIHWDDVVRQHPELADDGYHPNDKGARALACMIDQVLYASCRSPYPITTP